MKKYLFVILISIFTPCLLQAQEEDMAGCADMKYFKRLPNTFITDCAMDTSEMEFVIAPDSTIRLEGIKTFINYGFNPDKAKLAPSFERIVRKYEKEVLKREGKKMYYSSDAGTATLFLKSNNKDIWVVIDDGSGDGEGCYSISVLEVYP